MGLVIVTSLLGPYPRLISLGPITMAGTISVLVPLITFFLIVSLGSIAKSALRIAWPLAALAIIMWIQTYFQLTSATPRAENTPVIFSGTLIVMLAASITLKSISDDQFLKAFQRGVVAFTFSLAIISLTRDQDPATSQIAVIFFPFLIIRIVYRPSAAMVLLAGMIAVEIYVLESRIVVAALGIETLATLFLLRAHRPQHVALGIFLLVVGGAATPLLLDLKSFAGGGDQALKVNGISINTAGRLYYWGIIVENWSRYPIWGSGHSIPVEMFDVGRWTQPHNEYLRLLHMTGIVGVSLWIAFWLKLVIILWRKTKSSGSPRGMTSTAMINLAALVSTIGVAVLMATDNTLVYSYIVYLWALLVGRAAIS